MRLALTENTGSGLTTASGVAVLREPLLVSRKHQVDAYNVCTFCLAGCTDKLAKMLAKTAWLQTTKGRATKKGAVHEPQTRIVPKLYSQIVERIHLIHAATTTWR